MQLGMYVIQVFHIYMQVLYCCTLMVLLTAFLNLSTELNIYFYRMGCSNLQSFN